MIMCSVLISYCLPKAEFLVFNPIHLNISVPSNIVNSVRNSPLGNIKLLWGDKKLKHSRSFGIALTVFLTGRSDMYFACYTSKICGMLSAQR